jgi:hypothetical protein
LNGTELGRTDQRRAGQAPGQRRGGLRVCEDLELVDGFSIALGVPALLLVSVGSIVLLTATLSPLIWIVSVPVGLLQAFIFAEMAGLFPRKSGGHSLCGAEAWRRVNRFLPPITVDGAVARAAERYRYRVVGAAAWSPPAR